MLITSQQDPMIYNIIRSIMDDVSIDDASITPAIEDRIPTSSCCLHCGSFSICKFGKDSFGHQRYRCNNK